ncbi:unnamed protein product [Prunus armeniaca]
MGKDNMTVVFRNLSAKASLCCTDAPVMTGMLVSDTPPIRIRYGKRRIVDFSVMLTIFDTPWTHERYAQGYGGGISQYT